MKALITGINGQDGAYLAGLLLDKGYDVIGIMRKKAPTPNLDYVLKGRQITKFYYGDVSETEFIDHVIAAEKPDEIYNLAAQSHVGYSFINPHTTMQINYGGLVNIINAVKEFHSAAKIYQAGTSEMFGDSGTGTQNEETPFRPKSPYGISKVAAHHAGVNARAEGIWVSNGILFNHESPIRGEDFVTRKISMAIARVADGSKEPIVLGDVRSRRDWGFAGDYVDGMWRMLKHTEPDDFVLATGVTYSVLDFLDEASIVANVKPMVSTSSSNMRPNDLRYLCGDSRKAKEVLGWKPSVSFHQLVEMMVKEDMRRL